ncbi:MAG TPA: P1 family peptidase [Trueperaceae bacterium]
MADRVTLTSLAGLTVGHWTHSGAATGCTVILPPPEGCVASVAVRGWAPGTRETDLLAPEKTVPAIHGLILSGGSAFGLAAADGVMRWCEEQGRGFDTPAARVPIVPAAVIYDLGVGRADVRPDAEAGYFAATAANREPVAGGRVGAGAGATCGKYLGFEHAVPTGLGNAGRRVEGALLAALVVANPVGDIVDPDTAQRVAGAQGAHADRDLVDLFAAQPGSNTTLVAVATDAPLTKTEARILAECAHAGMARAIRPSHTLFDGDTAFALSTGRGPGVPLALLTIAVQEVVAAAVVNAARSSL